MSWLNLDEPTGWADIMVRTAKVVVVAFVVLQLKEYFDAGSFDTAATAADAAMIAGGTLLVNGIHKLLKT